MAVDNFSCTHRTGVLLNPDSGRLKKSGEKISRLAKALPGSTYREINGAEEARLVLSEFAAGGINILVVVAGDGTFHLVLSILLSQKMFKKMPVLVLIPAGTTNMTSRDFGTPGDPLTALKRLGESLSGKSVPVIHTKAVLRVSHKGNATVYGMFYGTGLIAEGVESFGRHGKGKGLTGEKASAFTFVRYLIKLLVSSPAGDEPLLRTDIAVNGGDPSVEPRLLTLISTLDRLLFGLKPYWGNGEFPMHLTILRQGPAKLLLRVLPVLFGRGKQIPKEGYFSENVSAVEMHFDGNYVVDGELYPALREQGAVCISADEQIEIMKLA